MVGTWVPTAVDLPAAVALPHVLRLVDMGNNRSARFAFSKAFANAFAAFH